MYTDHLQAREADPALFNGLVTIASTTGVAAQDRPRIARVQFSNGAMCGEHSHSGGQDLIVLAGLGRVCTETQVLTNLPPGSVVRAPANEIHAHGAAEGADVDLLILTWGTTDWCGERASR